MNASYTPCVAGTLARRVRAYVSDVSGIMAERLDIRAERLDDEPTEALRVNLGSGLAGELLFSLQRQRAFSMSNAPELKRDCERVEHALAAFRLGPGWIEGVAGMTAVLLEARDHPVDPSSVDEWMMAVMPELARRGSLDLSIGLTGTGLYMLERGHDDGIELWLESLEDLLFEEDEFRPPLTPEVLLSESRQSQFGDAIIDLGVAHGLAGLIATLTRCGEEGYARRRCDRVLKSAVDWFMTQKNRIQSDVFPSFVSVDGRAWGGESSWCYGDLGAALVLVRAGRFLEREDVVAAGLDAGLKAMVREPRGPGLCHGLAGLAHGAHRLYDATREPTFLAFAKTTFDRLTRKDPREMGPGLLNGIAGVGLACLSAISEHPLDWDRVLLMDVPDLDSLSGGERHEARVRNRRVLRDANPPSTV